MDETEVASKKGMDKNSYNMDVEGKKLLDIEVFEKGNSEPDIFEKHIKGLIKKACGDVLMIK